VFRRGPAQTAEAASRGERPEMEVAIGLPRLATSVDGNEAIEAWACAGEAAGFAALCAGDRPALGALCPLTALARAAAATTRVRLITSVLLLPPRDAEATAARARGLHDVSGGRLVLGVGVGSRPDDYAALGVAFAGRVRRFVGQLDVVRARWAADDRLRQTGGGATWRPPPIWIGATSAVGMRRAGRLADGFIWPMVGLPLGREEVTALRGLAAEHDRPSFTVAAVRQFILGRTVAEGRATAGRLLEHYYKGPPPFDPATAVPLTEHAVVRTVELAAEAGIDMLCLLPLVAEIAQVKLAAACVHQAGVEMRPTGCPT
jgi:alkanesulfonate monooxygenase SsuD/methylene tetrahydromethanopterin reductase-like flavin-dependent oxidoreductase (luciferase family)